MSELSDVLLENEKLYTTVQKLVGEKRALRAVLVGLLRGRAPHQCFCHIALDGSSVANHSEDCKNATRVLKEIK